MLKTLSKWSKGQKAAVFLAAVIVFLGVASGAWVLRDPESPLNREISLQTIREWARLSAFPPSMRNVEIETEGSMFTREFLLTFEADKSEILQWLTVSPGTGDRMHHPLPEGTAVFPILPGAGAQFAQLTLSADRGQVCIRVCWS